MYDCFGLKSVGGSWRDQLSQKIVDLGFIPCRDDPYVWMHEKNKAFRFECWYYVILYVDGVLEVSHYPDGVMNVIDMTYRKK